MGRARWSGLGGRWCPHPRGWAWHAADVVWTCWALRGVLVGEVRDAIKERWTRKMEVGRR